VISGAIQFLLESPSVELSELNKQIDQYIQESTANPALLALVEGGKLEVIKYMSAKYLSDVLGRRMLYASERAGFTWGDAIYVAPLHYPRTTMMYGEAGVVGTYDTSKTRLFNATNAVGVGLYQQWIAHQPALFTELTTTVHANLANRDLRNQFRARFEIDCVYFHPDESCVDYVDIAQDWWFAITHWDAGRFVGHGFSSAISDLKWCVVGPDAFEPEGKGHKAFIHPSLSVSYSFTRGHYTTLEKDIKGAYRASKPEVVICDFS
jgi:hypothetical protein